MGAAGSADAYRQTGFVLGKDIDMVVRGLELEGAIADASSGSKFRTQKMAASLGLWSRAWLSRLEALHAVDWGNYVAAVALVRAAADHQASSLYLLQTNAAEWDEWLAQGGVALAPEEHATEYRLHAFRAAEVLAAHEVLGPIYRTSMDLSLSHFGSTLLLAANESDPQRIAITFGDRDFHVALAELNLGWLLMLSVAQLEVALEYEGVFAIPDRSVVGRFCEEARAAAAAKDRCRVDVTEREGQKRYLVQNWRRAPGAAAKRILL